MLSFHTATQCQGAEKDLQVLQFLSQPTTFTYPLNSPKSCDRSHTAMQSLLSRQVRTFKLLVQQEGNDWARLIWLSDVELGRCPYNANALLQTPFSHERLSTTSMDGATTRVNSLKPSDWSHTAMQSLLNRQERAFKLLVQQEGNDWAHLTWLSDVELDRCAYNTLLQTQLSHGRLAERIEAEETEARNALRELFETEMGERLKSAAQQPCTQQRCEMWENERWTPMVGWGKAQLGRPQFTDVTGRLALTLSVFDSFIAQESLCWSSDGWELDMSYSVDPEGWQYALAFHTPFRPVAWPGALVRRRKWVRAYEPSSATNPATAPQEPPTTSVSSFPVDIFG